MSIAVCARCQGSGKISFTHEDRDDDGTLRSSTSGAYQCECVRDLPPIEGEATWWNDEEVWSCVLNDSIGPDDVVELSVRAEVPLREDGRRVVMRGNRYYPTWVTAHLPKRIQLHPEQARTLALKLMAAAEACDAVDLPDLDACGHWWPCDCRLIRSGQLPSIARCMASP